MSCAVGGIFFFQAEDGIRDLVRSRGLGDVYKRQARGRMSTAGVNAGLSPLEPRGHWRHPIPRGRSATCLLYTSDAADERSSVDLGGRRIIKKKKRDKQRSDRCSKHNITIR